ncbi:MAG: hypothetical protein LBJ10_08390 [Clostridiales bacterium]|jgi:hypothetical protein|nr:hypothetical protein [Clostridiales bacterium]
MYDSKALEEKLDMAEEGRRLWLALDGGRAAQDSGAAVVLAPTRDGECNYYGLLYLDAYLDRVRASSALVLSTDARAVERAPEFSGRARGLAATEREAAALAALWSLYRFTDRLAVLSLGWPYRERLPALMRARGLGAEDIVATGIYGLGAYRVPGRAGREAFEQ